MKDPVKRLGKTIALAVVFLLVYLTVMLAIDQRHFGKLIETDSMYKTEAIRSMAEEYSRTTETIGQDFREGENIRVRLAAIRLAAQISEGVFTGTRMNENSMVVRIHNGTAELPPEAEGLFPALLPEIITDEYKQTRTEMKAASGAETVQVLLTSGQIAGEWYYLRWTPVRKYEEYIASHMFTESLTEAVESFKDVEVFMVPSASSSDQASAQGDGTALLQKTSGFSAYDTLQDLGISAEDLKKESFSLRTDQGKEYICFPIELENLGFTSVCCSSVEGERLAIIADIAAQVIFVAVMLTGLITWCFSVQWMVERESLDEKQRIKYSPAVVKRRTARLAALSVLLVTLFAFLTVMVQYMYQENRIGSNVLDMLEARMEDEQSTEQSLRVMGEERNKNLGTMVSSMLTADPSLMERNKLEQIAKAVSADYIIVYDQNGKETACSRDYTGFVLPVDRSDSFYDFRRLLKGVPVIAHESEKDMITGETYSFIGVRYTIPGEEGAFGALVMAMPPSDTAAAEDKAEEETEEQVYDKMRTGKRMLMEIDPDTHMVLSCSTKAYEGMDAQKLGMDVRELKDRYMNFYCINGKWYYGIVGALGDSLYFYMKDSTDMLIIALLLALISGGLFLAGYTVTARYALKEYTDENYERCIAEMSKVLDGYRQKMENRPEAVKSAAESWSDMLPEMKTKTVMQILIGILIVVMILIAFGNTSLSRHSVLTFVMRGDWTRGVNLFSFIAVIVTFCIEYLAYLVIKAVTNILTGLTDAKGETVIKLIRSFINYAMFIGAVCVSLRFLGVDTTTLLASVGIMSFAVSLGAKDIVSDILAGLSIVFERTYYVGDIVEIENFKGKVDEIGVRSTKLINGNNDVKIISNHEIGSVVNYSKQTSVCRIRFNVPITTSLEDLKNLFEQELLKVKQTNPHIISGPKFDGIVDLADGVMTVGVSAGGSEEWIESIRKDLNETLQSMAERGEIKICAKTE